MYATFCMQVQRTLVNPNSLIQIILKCVQISEFVWINEILKIVLLEINSYTTITFTSKGHLDF